MDFKSIGAKIKESRLKMKLTQEKLAEKIDVSTSFLSRLENGSAVAGFETYCLICNALNITLDYLTADVILPTKKRQSEKEFEAVIENMNQDQIDYILNLIHSFDDYINKSSG